MRGLRVPSFIGKTLIWSPKKPSDTASVFVKGQPLFDVLMLKEKVESLLNKALEENPSLFLIDFTVGGDNTIRVILDGDQGVDLQDCMNVSRAIEHNLDREEEDFSLEVTSAGATSPLQLPRQYTKNIGRKIKVRTGGEELEGTLVQASENSITLEWKAREPKPVGKGKVTVQKKQEIAFSDIQEAKVILKF
jgi:ribosome maturation factor RimP